MYGKAAKGFLGLTCSYLISNNRRSGKNETILNKAQLWLVANCGSNEELKPTAHMHRSAIRYALRGESNPAVPL